MSATQSTLSTKTKHFYAITCDGLRRQAQLVYGAQTPNDVAPLQLVEFLISRRSELAKRTWRTYKAAVRAQLQDAIDPDGTEEPPSLQTLQEMKHALQVLEKEAQTGAKTRTQRTSALKAKNLDLDDRQRIYEHLQAMSEGTVVQPGPRSQTARALLTWCQASELVGVRPSEWEDADRVELEGGTPALRIRNAKNSHGRANGEYRHLDLIGLTGAELAIIDQQLDLIDGYRGAGGFAALVHNLRQSLYRIGRRVLGRRKKYPSLYTFRHQFAADAKSARDGRSTVAAMMGHGSDATAGRDYAHSRVGRGGVRVSPIPSEVAKVRRVVGARPTKKST